MPDSALLVDKINVTGTWYRHIRHLEGAPTDPLWLATAREGASRWQRDGVVRALYLADSIETTWAEWYRHLAEAAVEPSEALPREVWRFEINLSAAANLSTPQRIRRTGLPWPTRPTRETWPECQDVGHRLYAAGYPGLLTISAARSGTPRGRTVCIFRNDSTGDPPWLERTQLIGIQEAVPPPPRGLTT